MDLANLFNDEGAASERTNSITSGDLDPFLLQGDDQTWSVEDWNWDPFNMFAAPKETPNVACCQALKRRKVDNTGSSTAAQGQVHAQHAQQQQQQQQQQGQQAACCQTANGIHRAGGQPPAAAAACCSFTANQQQVQQAMQQLSGPLQVAMNSLAPHKVDTCALGSSMCHGPGAGMIPPAPIPAAAPVAATGPQMVGGGSMSMGMHGCGMSWPGLGHLGTPAAAAAAAMTGAVADPSFFTTITGGGGGSGPLAGMGWGAQAMALQMPSMPMQPLPGHMQYAPALSMPVPAFPTPSGVFQHQTSMALPPSSVPSPALGSSGETSSLQGSADNGKQVGYSGNRCGGGGPTCSGGRQQADSSNKATMLPPNKAQQTGAMNGGGGAGGDLSDFAMSDSDDEDEVARRGPAGSNHGHHHPGAPAQYPPHHLLGEVVALQDVADDNGLMVCQVPGCGKDLSHLKEYHQRYRICDVHIKLQQVMKDGRLQRFCQQCGRFHDLTAFDGNRKSCRDQLSKHNARRRRRAQDNAKGKTANIDPFNTIGGGGNLCGGAVVGTAASAISPFDGDVGKLLSCLMQNPTQLHALRLLLGVPTHPALPSAAQPSTNGLGLGGGLGGIPSPADSSSDISDQAGTYSLARDILAGRHEFAPAFESEHRLVRLSMKLFNRTPADLPVDLRNQVTSWLASAPTAVEASIRPGCVFLTVQLLVDEAGAAQAAAPDALQSLAHHLLSRTGCPFWHSGTYTLQLHEDMLVVRDGRVVGDAVMSGRSDGRYPVIRRMGPLAAVAGRPATLRVRGQHLDAPNCSVILRYGNKQLKAHLQPLSSHRAMVRLPPLPELCGPVWVEVSRGAYLSPAKQLLVARDEALVEEIERVDVRHGPLRQETVELLLQDLAMVLQHIAGEMGSASQLPHAAIALKARRLLAIACDMGWAAVASAVLPLACARCSCAAEMVAAIHAASVPSSAASSRTDKRGLTLLHRAVRSGSIPLLAGMLAWGDTHGYRWRVDAAGPAGITPLHLSALLDDARVGLLLLDHCGWPAAFTHLKSDGGVTPFHLAFQMGHYQVDSLMAALGGLHQIDNNNVADANNGGGPPAFPSGRRSRCSGVVVGCKLEETEDVKLISLRGHGHGHPQHQHHHYGKENGGAVGAHNNNNNNGSGCTELDPCEVCHCTLPPLLLSIMASCNECGRRRMCLEAESAAAAGKCGACYCGGARPTWRSDSGEVCSSRQHSTVFSITALCQGCHGNRVLAVA